MIFTIDIFSNNLQLIIFHLKSHDLHDKFRSGSAHAHFKFPNNLRNAHATWQSAFATRAHHTHSAGFAQTTSTSKDTPTIFALAPRPRCIVRPQNHAGRHRKGSIYNQIMCKLYNLFLKTYNLLYVLFQIKYHVLSI